MVSNARHILHQKYILHISYTYYIILHQNTTHIHTTVSFGQDMENTISNCNKHWLQFCLLQGFFRGEEMGWGDGAVINVV